MEKKDVFISYSSIETEEAHIIKGVLEKNGISCWMAPESIPIGSNYTKEIPEAISNCSAFLVLLSRNAIKSNWVPLELDRAYNEGKRIIPFFIEKCSLTDDFNFMLAKSERIEAYHRKAEALEELVNTIKNIKPDPRPHILRIILISILIALIAVGGVWAAIKFISFGGSTDTSGSAVETQAAEGEATVEQVTEVKESTGTAGDYVAVAREEYYDDINMNHPTRFRIPKITIDSDDARSANDEIVEIYTELMDAAANNDHSASCDYLDFDAYLNGDILSVVITSKYNSTNYYKYSVYNFDTSTGKALNNRALCKKLGTTWDDVEETFRSKLKEEYCSKYPNFKDTEFMYSTLSSNNLEASQLYLGSFKTLMADCTVYIGAGAGTYSRIIEIQNYSY